MSVTHDLRNLAVIARHGYPSNASGRNLARERIPTASISQQVVVSVTIWVYLANRQAHRFVTVAAPG
jgi:hypothetical protein